MRRALPTVLSILLVLAVPLEGQEPDPEVRDDLTRERAEEILAFLNDPGTIIVSGRSRVPEGTSVSGNVGAIGGPYQVGGRVDGRLVVLNGNLILEPGSEITGDIVVTGGRIQGLEHARAGGELTVYRPSLPYTRRGDELAYRAETPEPPALFSTDVPYGSARFTLRAASNYSRVEGLPVLFGPLFETAGTNPLLLEAFGIWRSTSGLSPDSEELGFRFRVEQAMGGRDELALGATLHSEVLPIEKSGLSNTEASLSTFLLRRDFRDYYEREGWSAYLRYTPGEVPLTLRTEFREDRHRSVPVRSPWTLGDDEEGWRPQPAVARGDLRSVATSLILDTRNDPVLPSDGWLVDVELRRGVGGDLGLKALEDEEGTERRRASPVQTSLTWSSVDLRRYLRIGPSSRLSLRAWGAGALSDSPLPPQLQRALGGEGSVPGHRRFQGDCGARAAVLRPAGADGSTAEVFPAYGCDRVALLQAELQRNVGERWNPLPDDWADHPEEWDWSPFLDFRPRWALFANAGRGWALNGPENGTLPRFHTPTLVDAGLGLFLGPVGLYWAYPVTERDRGINFFLRIHQRL